MNVLCFDIVICVGPNDSNIIDSMIPYTKKNIIGYRNIYLVCSDPTITIEGTITIDERIFPFSIQTFIKQFGNNNRNGWYLQQLLKIYSGNIIPNISKTYLILDSDTHFLKPTSFIDSNNKYLYTTGSEHHKPYFEHMNKLHPMLHKSHSRSGITHHMIVNNDYLNELMKLVENHHNNRMSFWEIFIHAIDPQNFSGSGASEYEIYFNFMNIYHKNKMVIRELNWKNDSSINNNETYDYISVHWYMRR